MKAAAIVPLQYLDLLPELGFTYHLALAHLVLKNEKYRAFFKKQQLGGGIVILDNSAHELGRGLEGKSLLTASSYLSPSILVVPDRILDASTTIRLAEQFLPLSETLPSSMKLMLVPHGLGVLSHRTCLRDLLKLGYGKRAIIGLNKSTARLGIRKELAQEAIKEGYKVHFLGIWANPIQEILDGKSLKEEILGIDSSYPVRLALSGRTLLEPFPTPQGLNIEAFLPPPVNPAWLRKQLRSYKWLVESECSSKEELAGAYKEGRFDEL